MQNSAHKHISRIEIFEGSVLLRGIWTVVSYKQLKKELSKVKTPSLEQVIIDGSAIAKIDSSGAWLLTNLIERLKKETSVSLKGFSKKHQSLLDAISQSFHIMNLPSAPKRLNFLEKLGQKFAEKFHNMLLFLSFIGQVSGSFFRILKFPKRFSFRQFFAAIEDTGVNAIPIVALLAFLIGIVLAYQMGIQLRTYGANIYIAYYSGMAMLREFAPLITAIISAGRTSSSFTALIGMMRINEEIDALDTMGIESHERLVIPRILGLLISLPLLTFVADICGVFGCMVMSKSMLDVGYVDYLSRLKQELQLEHYIIGLGKSPVFALIIASVGCFQGYQVRLSADSVGKNTTKSVVQAIFLIIIADAIFSVMFNMQKV